MMDMAETKRSWQEWLFTRSQRPAQEEKVLEYIAHRIDGGARLEEVVDEPYVRSNFSQHEIDRLVTDYKVIHAARERLESAFESGELDPGRRP
jgi:hypothetical protein